jgi:hypothetical protein
MGTFSDVAQGAFARRTISVVIGSADVSLDVRVLGPHEEAELLRKAREFAKARGLTDPRDGDPLYEYGRWLHTCVMACVDAKSPREEPRPFFDGGAEQILSSRVLTRAHLAYLAEHQEIWQAENAPYRNIVSDDALMERIRKIGEGDIDPFAELEPSMRWLFTRTLANLYIDLLDRKSHFGSTSPESTTHINTELQPETQEQDEPDEGDA